MGNQERDSARLHFLLERYRSNACTHDEMEQLFQLMSQGDGDGLLQGLQNLWEQASSTPPGDSREWDMLFTTMMEETRDLEPGMDPILDGQSREGSIGARNTRRRRSAMMRRWVAVSLFLLLVSGGAYLALHLPIQLRAIPQKTLAKAKRFKNDVQPGGNKAILTLADGSSILLDSAGDGTLSMQGNTRVLKLASGRLAYKAGQSEGDLLVFNTISTPKGGQYQIDLPDGSKVWLDASSSLRFPISFTGKEREVQLSGEAFFEITGDAHRPFAVSVFSHEPGMSEALEKVKVLGTRFNVMAYLDEKTVKTTLLDGVVRIGDAALHPDLQSTLNTPAAHQGPMIGDIELKPGEQAELMREHASGIRVVNDADVDAAVAWKNGYFNFNKADIQTIMRQLSRWYDIEVSFRGSASRDKVFFGGMQRDLPLSSIFNILERSGVQFSIDGRKVVVDM